MKLEGKVAIVTGGGRGIGRAIVIGYAKEGADLVLAARTKSEIEMVAEEIQALGRQALPIVTDISQEAEVENLVQQAYTLQRHIDVLVNNAAILDQTQTEIKDLDLETWNSILAVNLTGLFLCSRAVILRMISQHHGSIINISSGMGKKGVASFNAYSVSKAGVDRLTEILAAECHRYNIAVNSLEPGGTVKTRMIERTILGKTLRGLLEPEVMVPPAIFLATYDANRLTGVFVKVREWNATH